MVFLFPPHRTLASPESRATDCAETQGDQDDTFEVQERETSKVIFARHVAVLRKERHVHPTIASPRRDTNGVGYEPRQGFRRGLPDFDDRHAPVMGEPGGSPYAVGVENADRHLRVASQDETGASQVQVDVEPPLVHGGGRGFPLVQDFEVRYSSTILLASRSCDRLSMCHDLVNMHVYELMYDLFSMTE